MQKINWKFLYKIFEKKSGNVIIRKDSEEKGEKCMYKLVAIDLDGTLLNSYGEVS